MMQVILGVASGIAKGVAPLFFFLTFFGNAIIQNLPLEYDMRRLACDKVLFMAL
jgi:hypothetical protein